MTGSKRNAIWIFAVALAIIMIVFSLLNPHFMTAANMLKAFQHLSITAIAALGLTFVIVAGHSDMSFHYISCFAAMTMSYCISLKCGVVPSIVIGLATAALFGVVNGMLVGRFRLPDMVVTIGLGTAVYGLAYIYSGGTYIYRNFTTSGIMQLNNAKPLGVPLPIWFLAALYLAAWVLLHRTTFGRRLVAVGGNRNAAEFSGIRASLQVLAAFVICAVLASFTNMILVASQGKGELKSGLNLLMPAWAASFVGISIFGRATVYGTFIGAFLISIMQNGFTLMSISFYYMDFVIAMVLIVSIAVANRHYFTFRRYRN